MKNTIPSLFTVLFLSAATAVRSQEPAPSSDAAAPPNGPMPVPAVQVPPAAPESTDVGSSPTPQAPEATLPGRGASVPESYREDRYEATFKKNPFVIVTKAPAGPPGPGLAEDWELKGMQDLNGVQRVTLMNKKTSQFKRIGPEPDKDGFRLVAMNQASTRRDRSVKISNGTEEAELHFSDTPTPGKPMPGQVVGGMPKAGAPFAGNVNAGGPVRPTQGGVVPRPTTGGLPPSVVPGGVGGVPPAGTAPSSNSRRRLLVPTPAPTPGAVPTPQQ